MHRLIDFSVRLTVGVKDFFHPGGGTSEASVCVGEVIRADPFMCATILA